MSKTNIHLEASRADWRLIRTVFGPGGGTFAKTMLARRVGKVAAKLRGAGITEHSQRNREWLIEICAQ